MGTCLRSTRMISAAAVMHSGPCSSAPSKKRGKARAEIVKMLQGFGCEQVGFMDNFDDCSVLKIPAMDTALRLPIKVSSATSNFMIGVAVAGPIALGSV